MAFLLDTALVGKAMISQLKTVCKPFPKWLQRLSVNLVSPLTHSWDRPLTTAFPTTGGTTVNGIGWESNANHVLPKLPAFGFWHYLFQMFSSALDICLKGYSIIFYWTKFVLFLWNLIHKLIYVIWSKEFMAHRKWYIRVSFCCYWLLTYLNVSSSERSSLITLC